MHPVTYRCNRGYCCKAAPMRKAYERWLKDPVVVNPVSSDVAECLRPMLKAFNDAELIGDVSQPRFTEDRDAPFPPNHVDDELPLPS